MSTHFVKLYGSILQSTIWLEAPETKVLWITMLAMADSDGVVRASIPGLAHAAGISLEACVAGLQKFESPDPYSTTQHDEGRRLRTIDVGWKLTNHDKYREMRTKKQIQDAERQRKHRERDKCDVSRMSRGVAPYTDTYTDTDKEKNTPLPPKGGSGGKNPKQPKPIDPRAQRVVDAYNGVALERGWFKQDKVPLGGEKGDLLRVRIEEDDFMLHLDRYCELVKALNWADAKRITFFLRRQTFDKCLSGEWGPSESYSRNNKPIDQKRDIALKHEDYHGPFD